MNIEYCTVCDEPEPCSCVDNGWDDDDWDSEECAFPDRCLCPHPDHRRSECFDRAMAEAQEEDTARSTFERWVSAPPYERSLERHSADERVSAWPGTYRDLAVDLAWEAWRESRRMEP